MATAHHVAALTSGVDEYRWNRGEPLGSPARVTFSFLTTLPDYANREIHPHFGDATPATFSAFAPAQRGAALAVLDLYADVANLAFADKGDDGQAKLHFAASHQPDTLAYAYFPYPDSAHGGDVWLGRWPSMQKVLPGQVGFATLLHEVGHALGLKHPFSGVDGGSQAVLGGVRDSEQFTVMAYSLHPHSLYAHRNAEGELVYRDIQPSTPMLYDVAAIQHLYGANMQTRAGDDLYAFRPHQPFLMCIWDGGGEDTVSAAGFALGCEIDLRAGSFSDIAIRSDPVPASWQKPTYDGENNLSIAYGVTLEHAFGGSGDDTLRGNGADNSLRGRGGDDRLAGGAGEDRLLGGDGADEFVFGVAPREAGADLIADFTPGLDSLRFDLGAYSGLAGLRAGQFHAAPGAASAQDANDRLIYDTESGRLYYDVDGAGGERAVLVARLVGSPDSLGPGDIRSG